MTQMVFMALFVGFISVASAVFIFKGDKLNPYVAGFITTLLTAIYFCLMVTVAIKLVDGWWIIIPVSCLFIFSLYILSKSRYSAYWDYNSFRVMVALFCILDIVILLLYYYKLVPLFQVTT